MRRSFFKRMVVGEVGGGLDGLLVIRISPAEAVMMMTTRRTIMMEDDELTRQESNSFLNTGMSHSGWVGGWGGKGGREGTE